MTRNLHRLRAQAAHAVTFATVTLMLTGPARAAGSSSERAASPLGASRFLATARR